MKNSAIGWYKSFPWSDAWISSSFYFLLKFLLKFLVNFDQILAKIRSIFSSNHSLNSNVWNPKSLICQIAIQNPKHTKTLFMELFSALEQRPNLQVIPLCLFSKSYPFLTLLKPIHSIIFSNLFPPNPDPSASTISVKSYSLKLLYQIWFCFPLLYDNWY